MKSIILVGIGGAIGSIIRYVISILSNKFWHSNFPIATFSVNILGCVLIGLLFAAAEKQNIINQDLKLLLITGFCGGFTTFSTFSLENIQLLNTGQILPFSLNIILSVGIGIFGVWAGLNLLK